jgi:WD40 repeat protein
MQQISPENLSGNSSSMVLSSGLNTSLLSPSVPNSFFLSGHAEYVECLEWNPELSTLPLLLSVSNDMIRIWNLRAILMDRDQDKFEK